MNLIPSFLRRTAPRFGMPYYAQNVTREVPADSLSSTQPLIDAFWQSLSAGAFVGSPRLIDKVWAANRCIQLNSQQIASFPLRFFGPATATEPAWVSNPDPVWFPNGITDAMFAAVRSLYGWGDAFLYVTARYSTGFPSAWTVLDPEPMSVQERNGRRAYESGGTPLDPADVVQISRDPRGHIRGTTALSGYGSMMMASLAKGDTTRAILEGGIPNAVLKSKRRLDKAQAQTIKAQWAEAAASRRGEPAILPPELDFEMLQFSPRDLLLLELQEFDARVIASAFGVPPFMLNVPLTGGLTYQNPAMLGEFWWRTELRPTSKRIADALTANMLPRGQSVLIDASELFAPLGNVQTEAAQAEPIADASPNVQPLRPVQEEVRP